MSSTFFAACKVPVVTRLSRRTPWGSALGERLAEAIEHDFTQRQFAERLGVTEAAVSTWIAGAVPDAWDRLRRVCELSGASADALLGLKSASARPPTPPPDESAPVPQVWVPLVADVAAGEPTIEQRSEPEDFYSFKLKWAERVVKSGGSSVDRLFAVKVRRGKGGDSMRPTIRPGASLVVDPGPESSGVTAIEDGRVYVVRPTDGGGGWTVKRAWLDKHYLVLKGDNPEVRAMVEDMRGRRLRDVVVGKVVYVGQEEE